MLSIAKKAIQAIYWNNHHVRHAIRKFRLWNQVFDLKRTAVSCQNELNVMRARLRFSQHQYPLKVAFLVTENAKWNTQSVYDALEASERFKPFVITFPKNPQNSSRKQFKKSEQENFSFFKTRNMRVMSGYDLEGKYLDLQRLAPDIVFYEQPHQTLPDQLWVDAVNQYALTCYVPYGIMSAKIQQLQFNREFHHNIWRLFCESELHNEMHRTYSDIGNTNVVTTGHPKLDAYLDCTIPSERFWKQNKKPQRKPKRIIWAPHFSIKNREVAYSTFHKNYKFFLKLAKREKMIDWVVKPHPWLRSAVVKYGLMTALEVKDYFEEWQSLENATLYEEGDYFDLFKTSDAIILDCVSFIAEYMPTGNPMLFLVNKEPPVVGFNEYGTQLLQGLYKAYSIDDIENFVTNIVLNQEDPLKEIRMETCERLIPLSQGGAGKAILAHLEAMLIEDV